MQIHILFKDGEVFECHLIRDTAEARLELHVHNDLEQAHTWSLTPFEILSWEE